MKKIIILMVVLLAATALMAETDFYGSLRSGWWYNIENEDLTGGDSRFDFALKSYYDSRVGMDYTKDGFVAKIEMGLSETNVSLRHAYGEQDLGTLKVLIGRTFTGFSDFAAQGYGTACDIYLAGYGMMYDGVKTQIKFTLPNGLYFSLIEPTKMNFIPGYTASEMDAIIPKINVGMHYDLGNINLHPTFGFAMSNYNEDLAGMDEAITAYAFALTGKCDMTPLKLQGQINFGQNIGNYGFKTPTEGPNGMAGWVNDEIVNVTTMGGYLQAAYEMLTVGAGYTMDDSDSLNDPDATMNTFVQYKIKLGNICLMPEAGVIDYMENGYGVTTGAMTYFGLQMRVTIP